jgi:hypothetical protein
MDALPGLLQLGNEVGSALDEAREAHLTDRGDRCTRDHLGLH